MARGCTARPAGRYGLGRSEWWHSVDVGDLARASGDARRPDRERDAARRAARDLRPGGCGRLLRRRVGRQRLHHAGVVRGQVARAVGHRRLAKGPLCWDGERRVPSAQRGSTSRGKPRGQGMRRRVCHDLSPRSRKRCPREANDHTGAGCLRSGRWPSYGRSRSADDRTQSAAARHVLMACRRAERRE